MSDGMLIFFGFAAAVSAVVGIYSVVSDLYLRDRSRVSQRVDEEFGTRQRERAQKSLLFKDLALLNLEGAEGAEEYSWRQRLAAVIEQSGLELGLNRLLTIMLAAGLFSGAIGALVGKSVLIGGLVGLLGAYLPLGYVLQKRKARLGLLIAQLADAFELMARCVRVGQTMSQALQAVADEFDPPISVEFSFCYEQMNLGLSPELAMRELARRTGLLEIKVFVLAMLIQTQTGGNLAEMLEKLAGIIRERFKIRGKIMALTAEGRLQAMVLMALPVMILGAVMVLNRTYAAVFFARPGILITMLVFEVIGGLWIRRIINFDY